MKKLKFIVTLMLSAVFFSCSSDEDATLVKNSANSSKEITTQNQTEEMIAFKEALAEFSRLNSLDQKNGQVTSLFNSKRQDVVLNQAKALLSSNGFSDAELKKLNNSNVLLIKALKVYAEKTKLTH